MEFDAKVLQWKENITNREQSDENEGKNNNLYVFINSIASIFCVCWQDCFNPGVASSNLGSANLFPTFDKSQWYMRLPPMVEVYVEKQPVAWEDSCVSTSVRKPGNTWVGEPFWMDYDWEIVKNGVKPNSIESIRCHELVNIAQYCNIWLSIWNTNNCECFFCIHIKLTFKIDW